MVDISAQLQIQVQQAVAASTPLNICAGNTKRWYGREAQGETLSVAKHTGIVAYRPDELTVTVRAGTPLYELQAELADRGQHLAFEPPSFSEASTIGGTVACGFSGASRPFSGSCRDYVLGCRIINGRGEILRFGGEVMKNVAGFDVSRLMVGSLGTLGVLLDISFKVMPQAQHVQTFFMASELQHAVPLMRRLANASIPVTGLAADEQGVYLRMSGVDAELQHIAQTLAVQQMPQSNFWHEYAAHKADFFAREGNLWRFSLPPSTPHLAIQGVHPQDWFLDWAGAQRWLYSALPAERLFQAAKVVGGHACLFRAGVTEMYTKDQVFQPLPTALMQLHQRLKQGFDPHRIFNIGRMYEGL